MGEIFLIRHGQAMVGAANYDQLSELGFEQSRQLGRWLAESGCRFARAVSGTQQRHLQTAAACLSAISAAPPPHTDPGFNEFNRREMMTRYDARLATPEGVRAVTQAHADPLHAYEELFLAAFARWITGEHDSDYRESFEAFRQRCLEALDRHATTATGDERIIVFTSGGPIAVILQSVLGLPDHEVATLNLTVANAAVTALQVGASGRRLLAFNSYQHLQRRGDDALLTFR